MSFLVPLLMKGNESHSSSKGGTSNVEDLIISIVGLVASMSSIVFAFLAFRRSDKSDQRKEGRNEGTILSDIGYIKACVDRVEKNMSDVDKRYRDIIERLAKVEESLEDSKKRIDELNQRKEK